MTPRFLEFIYTRQGYQPNVALASPSRPDLDHERRAHDAAVALELRPQLVETGAPEGVVGADPRPERSRYPVVLVAVGGLLRIPGFAVTVGESASVFGDDGDVGGGAQVWVRGR